MRTVFERRPADASAVAHSLAGTRQAVYWWEDVPRTTFPRLEHVLHTDLVVVGGGYTGLWTAVRAKERDPGTRVVLLEGQRIGWAASGRNGGFCEASLTHGHGNGAARWPQDMPTLDRLGAQNLDDVERTVRRYGMDVDLERTGQLKVATEEYQLEDLLTDATGEQRVVLDEAAVRAEVNSPTYLGGLWEKDSTLLVHPAKLAAELARVAAGLGVEIFEGSPVTAVQEDGGGVVVHTAAGSVHARHAVLGTNAFPSLLRRNTLMTIPVYDYIVVTEPLTDAQTATIGWGSRQGLSDLANQFHYYRLTADNRIVFGGYDAIYHFGRGIDVRHERRDETFRRLAEHFFTTFPQLAGVRFTHRWAGVIDTSTRFCAFFGTAHHGRTAYAAGFTGLGVAATRFAGDTMLDLLSGTRTERTELAMVRRRPLPFPPEPVAAVGVNLTRWSLQRADHRTGQRNVLLRALDKVGLGFAS
ncbi:NAD(P)/FAD-dependent oxidoreductase [Kineococcus rhizosphaerae]|uniref:Glycine/D-amino acid oxidase-like deaminating enzyme n=1 Tax=Kineococcus rhizosphaerae TaxID=559628 RepID=A0A2T0QX61_9ACTN|nr:FAD-dependent oxidoreductase [Kineococcus rhizosphaerae]PRY10474.1 glycine/D-amino acid oxidase-like deaminating enzyme [Kineococcus rhizosphaerae]